MGLVLLCVIVLLCNSVTARNINHKQSRLWQATVPGTRHYTREQFDRSHANTYFEPTEQNITVHPGDRAVLHCQVENLGTKTVSWRKDGFVAPLTIGMYIFTQDTRMNIERNRQTREWNLIIQDVKPEDEGWYHCQVTTKKDQIYYSIKLNVLSEPDYAVEVTGTEYVERGNPVELICNATGKPDPPHNVDWYKDGEKLESDAEKGIIITRQIETKALVSMLVIKRCELDDAAEYICRSSNQDEETITVHVLDVPGPPKNGEHADTYYAYVDTMQLAPFV